MGIRYDDYVDQATDMLTKVLSVRSLRQEDSAAIVSAVTEELAENIGDTSKITNFAPLIYAELIRINDRKITEALSEKTDSYTAIEEGIRACEQQQKLLTAFAEEKWPIPEIKNHIPQNNAIALKQKLETRSISDKIVEEDQQLSSLISIAQAELTVDACDAALEVAEALEADISACRKKGVAIPEINHADTQKTAKSLKLLRETAEKKEALYQKIYKTDAEIASIASRPSSKDQWPIIISLCQQQLEQFKMCESSHWPLPAVRYAEPSEVEKQYKLYQRMNQTDRAITEQRELLTSKKKYIQFQQLCSDQQSNIDTCEKNGWGVPLLLNREPGELVKKANDEKQQEDKRRKAIRKRIRALIIFIACVAVGILCFKNYTAEKAAIPFDSNYPLGADPQHILKVLQKAGFKNIEQQEDKSGWLESGKVTGVTIGGNSVYMKNRFVSGYVDENTRVIILISSRNRIDAAEVLNGWAKLEYEDVRQKLDEAGFTNIGLAQKGTLDQKNENLTAEIMLNGIKYENGSCFIPQDARIIISFYVHELNIGHEAKKLLGQDYNQIVDMLREKGFVDVQTQEVTTGWNKPDTVVELLIDGKPYDDKVAYSLDARILVKYSCSNRIDLTEILKKWDTRDYREIVKGIKDCGIDIDKIYFYPTLEKKDNKHIKQILIDGIKYTDGDCAPLTGARIRIEFYKLQIKLGKFAKNYKNQQYTEVKKTLNDMGFENISYKRTEEGTFFNPINKRNEGKVIGLSIGETQRPNEDDIFYYDQEVVLTVKTRKGEHYVGMD